MTRRLLWASPFSLHDTSSGAALQAKTMLECFAKEGIEVVVLGSFVFDSFRGTSTFPNLEEELKKRGTQPIVMQDEEKKIVYHYLPCNSRAMALFTHDEAWRLFGYFSGLCNRFRPDIVMGYGVGTLGVAMQAESKRRGIPFVYTLFNGNHPNYHFWDCDLILTDSQATANLYALRDRLNVQAGGIFIEPEKYLVKKRNPQYITLVNPHPTKGVSIFAKLALVAQKEFPDEKFLVVESRGSFKESLPQLHESDNNDVRPYRLEMFSNVDVANHTNNMKEVYKITKVLVAPSLWYESWGRVATEAVMNGIPCLVSTSGGLSEAMGEAGIAIQAPQSCQIDHLRIPTDEEIIPWVDALRKILGKDYTKECEAAAKQHSLEKSTQRTLEILEPLFIRKASYNPKIINSGILNMKADGSWC
ncbi:hypothetical protein CCZ01_08945 [Helicobacter monodelphidis]|uniref:glycosyltransferase n=1 Tax=Helicobacter sp. 15-1451 TaxID=2004995 RepID=UPI000DCE5A58|nr:glycosyltransferase [Helicobacter sp. 15-1451]RAX56624.1 hypothetical protein CCZ01_08945 [Helicobacter sp. 15-1451]